ncbi:MAG: VTT domain-containing protein [Alphaproteobacteria bacterium]
MSNLSVSRLSMLAMIGLASIGVISAIYVGVDDRLGIDLLRQHQNDLIALVTSKPVLAGILFTTVYALFVATSMPGLAIFTMAGGYLFGWFLGAVYTMIAATIASTFIFLLARSAIGEAMRERAGPMIQRFAKGFKKSALSYVFIMHLVPILPYMVVTTVPAACGVPLPVYMFSAFFGILPATVLLARIGSGLGDVLATEGPIDLTNFMTPDITLSVVGLAALALLPVIFRALKPALLQRD